MHQPNPVDYDISKSSTGNNVTYPLGLTVFHTLVFVLHEKSGDAVLRLAYCSYHDKDRLYHLQVIKTKTGHTSF